MLDILSQLEQALPEMLLDESIWRSLYVDYHPPFVERLWAPGANIGPSCTESIPATERRLCSTPTPGLPRCASSKGNTRWPWVLAQGWTSHPSPLSWFRAATSATR